MTSFFEQQDRARRNTTLLVVLMALGVIGMGLGIYALVVVVESKTGLRLSASGGEIATPLFQPQLLLAALLGTGVIVAIASGTRVLSLRGGGAQIAEMLGGRLISGSPRDALEKRLLNVVEEMALASGVPVPQVFVLEEEEGINAFAAGHTLSDAAIAVTRGCLEKLTRDELQGVIAHEFSHVLNGDMRLNIQLMGIVFGIVCIGLLGRILIRIGDSMRWSSRRDSDSRGSPAAGFFILGFGVLVIGMVGELCGKLIKAAVSRQREYLADASAVQFTRNPLGIGGALKKIGGFGPGAKIAASHAEEASHFFFGDIHKHLFSANPFATHPALSARIARIDPSFHGEFPEVGPGIAEPDDGPVSGFASAQPVAAGASAASHASAEDVVARVGVANAVQPERGRQLLDDLPPALRAAASNPFSACASVHALLLSDQGDVAQSQYALIEQHSGSNMLSETLRLAPVIAGLRRRDRLSLVELLSPALRQLSRDQRAVFTRTVRALIDADSAVSIFEYVLGQTLSERMSDDQSASARARVRHRSLRAVEGELQLLLSLLGHAGAADPEGATQAFAAAVERLPGIALSLLPQSERLLIGLGGALLELRALSPQLCAQVVDACAHAVLSDRRVTDDEATLLGAVCSALGCPQPSFGELETA